MKLLMPAANFAAMLALLALSAAASAADFDVPLTVHESAGLDRTNEPVSGGVPFPMGALKNATAVLLVDADGNDVPAQFSAINRWGHDGSVQWLLVQAAATVPANGKTTFRLVPGRATAVVAALKVRETEEVIRIETGKLVFAVGKKRFGLTALPPDVLLVDGPGGGSTLTLANGEVYSSAAGVPKQIVVEERGPRRVTILVRGLHLPVAKEKATLPYLYGYVVRIRAFAGQPFVRISYTLTNGEQPAIGMPMCKDFQIALPLALKVDKPAGGDDWVAASDGKAGIHAAVRYLKRQSPATLGIETKAGVARVVLKPWADGREYLDVCSRKTYEIQLTLGPGRSVVENGEVIAKRFNSALRFWCPPQWVSSTKAWGDFGSVAVADEAMAAAITRRFRPFSMTRYIERLMKSTVRREAWRFLGAMPEMESGSSSAPSGGYEPLLKTAHLYLIYLQTADRRFFDQLERTSWFWRDRFMIYLDADFSRQKYAGRGGVYRKYLNRGVAAFGDVQRPKAIRDFGYRWNYSGRWGPMDAQHFSVDEVVNYYYLTGDRACLDALKMYGMEATSFVNAWLAAEARDAKATISRAHGWVTRALMSCYEATGDEQLLETARKAVASIIRNQDKRVGTIYDVKQQQVPFMAAAVGMALGRFYRHHPEEDVRDAILGLADWLAHDVAIPGGGFAYRWDWDKPSKRSGSGTRCMSTMSWAHLAAGKQQYMDAADLHAGLKAGLDERKRQRIFNHWQVNGFGQEYVSLKRTKRADATPPSSRSSTPRSRSSSAATGARTPTARSDSGPLRISPVSPSPPRPERHRRSPSADCPPAGTTSH